MTHLHVEIHERPKGLNLVIGIKSTSGTSCAKTGHVLLHEFVLHHSNHRFNAISFVLSKRTKVTRVEAIVLCDSMYVAYDIYLPAVASSNNFDVQK